MRPGRARLSGADIVRHIRRMTLLLRGEDQALSAAPKSLRGQVSGQVSEQVRDKARELLRDRDREPDALLDRAEGAATRGPGWWVLAQGKTLDPEDFAAREAARDELLASVRQAGVLVGENVWVWDESGRAQLVLSTLPTVERARRVAERLRQKGLVVVVRRELA